MINGISNIRNLVRFPTFLVLALMAACSSVELANPELTYKDISLPTAPASQGWLYLRSESPELAERVFRSLLHENPQSEEALYGLAEALRHSGKLDEAEQAYEKASLYPEYTVRSLEGIGLTLLQRGDINEAQASLKVTTERYPGAWRAWLGLAKLRDRMRYWDLADDAYTAAMPFTDQPHIVINNQGISYLARGDAEGAAQLFRTALRYKADFAKAQTNLELALASQGKAPLNLRTEADPRTRARKLNNTGYIAMLQGDLARAESLLLEALETYPSYYANAEQNLHVLRTLQAKAQH